MCVGGGGNNILLVETDISSDTLFGTFSHKKHRHHGGRRRALTKTIQQSTIIFAYRYVYRTRLCASAAVETIFCWSKPTSRRIPYLAHFHTQKHRHHGGRRRALMQAIQQSTIIFAYRYVYRTRLCASAAAETIVCWSKPSSRRIRFRTHFSHNFCTQMPFSPPIDS